MNAILPNTAVTVTPNMPMADYLKLPSLSASGMVTLLETCPAKYRYLRDNPKPDDGKFAIGTAAHLIVLEPHLFAARTVLIDADSYRTAAAKEARAEALATGRVPLLADAAEQVMAMRDAVWSQAGGLFAGCTAESTLTWTDAETGVALRCRPDLRRKGLTINLKTTASARPEDWQRRIWDNGHHVSVAHYDHAERLLHPDIEPQSLWLVVETEPPHLVAVFEPDEEILHWGRKLWRRAVDEVGRCEASGEWPGYGHRIQRIGLAGWQGKQLAERDAAGDFERLFNRESENV